MTKLFHLESEVVGGFGEGTIVTNYDQLKVGVEKIPKVEALEYVFDDWLGDDLLESTPCFVVTERLATLIETSNLAGYSLADMLVSKSDLFRQIHNEDLELPKFLWLKVLGHAEMVDMEVRHWSGDDFCSGLKGELIVTERCLHVLQRANLKNCTVSQLAYSGFRPIDLKFSRCS